MKTTKITIKNLFGITEQKLTGANYELTGKIGTNKTSVLDAIRYALTNDSKRDYIIKNGTNEGEILVETDSGLRINRKKRENKADYKSIRENNQEVTKPESFLQEIFTPLQLDPVEFSTLPRQEQNRRILELIEFEWNLNWIKEKFGELPSFVDYSQHILEVLNQIQSDKGDYYLNRQDIQREIRHIKDHVEKIATDIPENYNATKWESYPFNLKYRELTETKEENSKIERAIQFKEDYENKKRGIEAESETKKAVLVQTKQAEKTSISVTIEKLKAELKEAETKLLNIDNEIKKETEIIEKEKEIKIDKLNADTGIASNYAGRSKIDTTDLQKEIDTASEMIKHLNEYKRMRGFQKDIEDLTFNAQKLTEKIELARELPSFILENSNIPISNLTIKDGLPLINGLPISNLSSGEVLKLCVDIAVSKPNRLQIILLDGTEKLDDSSRQELYKLCKEKGLQFIATRTTNDNELNITEL